MHIARTSILFASLLLMGSAAAQATRYDGAKAVTATEQAICASPSLDRKDAIVATYYDLLLHLKPATAGMAYREFDDQLRNGQQQFLAARTACGGDASCLDKRYDDRIVALREFANRYGAVVFDRPTAP